MNYRTILTLITAFILTTLTGCGSTANTAVNVNSANAAPANTSAPNAANAITTNKKPETASINNAPTLAPVVNAYYDALKKKDDAAVKKVMTQDFIKYIEAQMKEEKKTSIAAYMAESDRLDTAIETRNEKIEGSTATAELKGGTYVNWTPFKFVKENGEWKLTNEYPDVNAVKESANTAVVNKGK